MRDVVELPPRQSRHIATRPEHAVMLLKRHIPERVPLGFVIVHGVPQAAQ